ncbi:MAG: phosphatase PAP2 family protein [Nitrososphaeraceae archaeon]|nr:phosphatase PAP2 family protein [Nitrososphaeraceae archaeon]
MPKLRSPQFVIIITLFFLLTALVATKATSSVDSAISLYASNIPPGSDMISLLIIGVTSLGDVVTLVIISIVLSIIRRTRKQGLILLITILLTVILLTYIKPIVARDNPDYPSPIMSSNVSRGFVIEGDTLSTLSRDYSYPSNHVAISTAFAFIVGYALNKRSRISGWLIWSFPFIVALTRILLIQHYVTDAIGGLLFGLIVSIIMSNVMHLGREVSIVKST